MLLSEVSILAIRFSIITILILPDRRIEVGDANGRTCVDLGNGLDTGVEAAFGKNKYK